MPEPHDIVFFPSPQALAAWFAAHAATARVLWVGYYRRHTGRPSLTWPESVDEALCVGWIDGVRKTVDADRYTIRFTPRRTRSPWSNINIARVAVLTREGRMQPAGAAAFAARDPAQAARASYEQREAMVFDADCARRFHAKKAAWRFFSAQPPGYRRLATFWVMSAKRDETRRRRLDQLMADCAAGRRLGTVPGASKENRRR